MSQNYEPVCFRLADCLMRPTEGSAVAEEHESNRKVVVYFEPADVSVVVSTDHGATEYLLKKMWDAEPANSPDLGVDIYIQQSPDIRGRIVDPASGRQWLFSPYVPFTVIKQALRWQFTLKCTPTPWMPLHGALFIYRDKCIGLVGASGTGKSYLTDFILSEHPGARMFVDDWCMVNSETGHADRLGETYLHIRGASMRRRAGQLEGAGPFLAELCDDDPWSIETRYLVSRERLSSYDHASRSRVIDAIIIFQEPLADEFTLSSDSKEVAAALRAEGRHFWDDSNLGLPDSALAALDEKWLGLTRKTLCLVARGHRREGLSVNLLAEKILRKLRLH